MGIASDPQHSTLLTTWIQHEESSPPLCPLPPSVPSSGLDMASFLKMGGLAAGWQRGRTWRWIAQAVTSGHQLVLPAGPSAGLSVLDGQSLSVDVVRGQFLLFASLRSLCTVHFA